MDTKLLQKSLDGRFYKSLKTEAQIISADYCDVDSTLKTKDKDYVFHDVIGQVREFSGEYTVENVKNFLYSIRSKHFFQSIGVDKDDLEFTKSQTLAGIPINIQKEITNTAKEMNLLQDELINELLVNGATLKAFDDTEFFANARPNIGGTGLDNIITGTGTTLTDFETDFSTGLNRFAGMRDKNGKPFHRNKKIIVLVPSSLQATALKLLNSEFISPTNSNVWRNTFEVVVNDYQDPSILDWYMINKNATIKPFLYQRTLAKSILSDEKLQNKFVYITKIFANAGYGNPLSILKINN